MSNEPYGEKDICEDCGQPFEFCDCPEWIEDDRPTCGCPNCFCSNPTISGEICGDCLAGAHQG